MFWWDQICRAVVTRPAVDSCDTKPDECGSDGGIAQVANHVFAAAHPLSWPPTEAIVIGEQSHWERSASPTEIATDSAGD